MTDPITAYVAQTAQQENAVPWPEVKTLFRALKPVQTGHELIRIGPDHDGGYLLPDDLEGIEAVFSPGVSDNPGFDMAMSARCRHCYLADASVEQPVGLASNMSFVKKFIGNSPAPEFITLEDWITGNEAGDHDLLLQMDIEGAEYDVLNTVSPETLSRFRIILIEFHDFENVFKRDRFERFSAAVARLNESHVLCHIHSNNCTPYYTFDKVLVPPVFEASYIRKDRVTAAAVPAKVPHRLDQRNNRDHPDSPVPRFWTA